MVRTYKRKTSQGQWSHETMEEAANMVLKGKLSIRRAADVYGVPFTSLQRRVSMTRGVIKNRGGQQTLTKQDEKMLADRLLNLAKRGFGLTPQALRKYAYVFAERKQIKHTFNKNARMAGEDWFHRFLQRNEQLSIRKPEGLSRARINGMTKEKVADFFNTLEKVIDTNNLRGKPECIYNVDETGMPLNNRPPNIVAMKGSKDVVSMTSVERGENVTVLACMNATGQYIPPFVIFKGVRKRDDFMIGMPPGTEIAMTEKGWINEDTFKLWVHHFNKYRTRGKVILLLDGHASHVSYSVVDLCDSLDIELVLLPPHTSHALQPLDVSFFKPLKCYYNQQATAWQHSHPNMGISKVSFGGILKAAWNQAATVGNACSGFEKTGIYPLNANSVPDHKYVADAPTNDSSNAKPATEDLPDVEIQSLDEAQPSTSEVSYSKTKLADDHAIPSTSGDQITLQEIIPSPLKTPNIVKKPRKITKPLLHLTSPLSKSNLLNKAIKKEENMKTNKKEGKINDNKENLKKKNKETSGQKTKGNKTKRDWHCIYCSEKFVHPPREDWIQCAPCQEWCHEKCTDHASKGKAYTCELCRYKELIQRI